MEKFIGIPYVPHGRDYSGADCWGLLYLFYRDLLRTPVPAYSAEMDAREFKHQAFAPLINAERQRLWVCVEDPRHGDGVLMRAGRYDSHVGIYLANGRMLHSEGPEPSVIERISDLRWRNRISGFYRLAYDADTSRNCSTGDNCS